MKSKIAVIGGLAAGPAAASKASRTNKDSDVILFERGEHISYGICELPYFIGNKIKDINQLIVFTPEKLKSEKNVTVKNFNIVREINPQKRELTILNIKNERIEKYYYDKLIISTGSNPTKHTSFNESSNNLFYFKSIQDAIRLKKFIEYYNPQKVTIVGSGFIGLELAESIISIGLDVTILNINELPLNKFEDEIKLSTLNLIRENRIKFIKYNEIKSIEYKTELDNLSNKEITNISRIKFDNNSIETDLVIIAIGIEPNTDLAKNARIAIGNKGGILVDSRMATSVSNIYAAGDCCEIKDSITNKYIYSPFATTALKTGWAAGENAAGGNASIKGTILAYTLTIFGTEIAHVGLTLEDARANRIDASKEVIEGWVTPKIYPDSEKILVILVYDKKDGKIIGGETFGKKGSALRANILSSAIYQRLTIKDLINMDFVYNPPSTPLRDPLLLCANSALKSLENSKK